MIYENSAIQTIDIMNVKMNHFCHRGCRQSGTVINMTTISGSEMIHSARLHVDSGNSRTHGGGSSSSLSPATAAELGFKTGGLNGN